MTEDKSIPIEPQKDELDHCKTQLGMMLQLTRAAAGTSTTSHVISRALETIVTSNNWGLGQYWRISEEESIARCSELYFSVSHLPEFRSASVERRITKGIELPGRVWATSLPV